MQQYVLVRITRMDDVDLGLFEHDRHNTLYFYVLNADEQIYLRYGGRDSRGPDTYLSLDSIELALRKGLDLHKQYQEGKLAAKPRPPSWFARELPLLVERTFAKNNCVECHLIGDFQNQHREIDGKLDKRVHLFRSPDIRTIGIELDVPKGLVVKEATGAAAQAGMKAGDLLAAVNGTNVYTFADFQHAYDQVSRDASSVRIAVERDGVRQDLNVSLPPRWWFYDTRYRQSSVEPRTYFEDRPLTAAEKTKLGLKPEGFASMVTRVDMLAEVIKNHTLRVGDVIASVNGVSANADAHTAELYVKLNAKAGESVKLAVLRNGKPLPMDLKTLRMSFRK
jgi:hypothetical protein